MPSYLSSQNYSLHSFVEEFRGLLRAMERRAASSGISYFEERVLSELRGGPRRSAALVKSLDADRGQFSRTIKSLVGKGWIRTSGGSPGAPLLVSLTGQGSRAWQQAYSAQWQSLEKAVADLGERRRDRLFASMQRMGDFYFSDKDIIEGVWMRDAQPDDLPSLLRGIIDTYPNMHPALDLSVINYALALFAAHVSFPMPESDVFLVAISNALHLGSLLMTGDRQVGDIHLVTVFQGYQSHGVGTRLLHECETRAIALGYRQLRAAIPMSQTGPTLYERREGWELIAEVPQPFCGQDVIMQSWLRDLR